MRLFAKRGDSESAKSVYNGGNSLHEKYACFTYDQHSRNRLGKKVVKDLDPDRYSAYIQYHLLKFPQPNIIPFTWSLLICCMLSICSRCLKSLTCSMMLIVMLKCKAGRKRPQYSTHKWGNRIKTIIALIRLYMTVTREINLGPSVDS